MTTWHNTALKQTGIDMRMHDLQHRYFWDVMKQNAVWLSIVICLQYLQVWFHGIYEIQISNGFWVLSMSLQPTLNSERRHMYNTWLYFFIMRLFLWLCYYWPIVATMLAGMLNISMLGLVNLVWKNIRCWGLWLSSWQCGIDKFISEVVWSRWNPGRKMAVC